jgi:hypothetical protein
MEHSSFMVREINRVNTLLWVLAGISVILAGVLYFLPI